MKYIYSTVHFTNLHGKYTNTGCQCTKVSTKTCQNVETMITKFNIDKLSDLEFLCPSCGRQPSQHDWIFFFSLGNFYFFWSRNYLRTLVGKSNTIIKVRSRPIDWHGFFMRIFEVIEEIFVKFSFMILWNLKMV